MTGINHKIGGLAVTGIFCSFWNVNIFEKPMYLVATLFFALLPDIDHTKSLMGKMFYPLAKWLDRNYGHRTITHSLAAMGTGILITTILAKTVIHENYVMIFGFAYGSHLLFDMMTKQGVPLLYPWKKNPCVIPGDANLRFESDNMKTESIIFLAFGLLIFTTYPLMANGFWTTYNRSFGTLKHLAREFKESKDILQVDYSYFSGTKTVSGSGIVIKSDDSKAVIFEDGRFVEIDNKVSYSALKPNHTGKPYEVAEIYFFQIEQDSLARLLRDKILLIAHLQSDSKMKFQKGHFSETNEVLKFENQFNPEITCLQDSLNKTVVQRIEIKQIERQEEGKKLSQERTEFAKLTKDLAALEKAYQAGDFEVKESLFDEVRKLRSKRENWKFTERSEAKALKEIEYLKQELSVRKFSKVTGYIQWLVVQN
jgi:inner membrane protein